MAVSFFSIWYVNVALHLVFVVLFFQSYKLAVQNVKYDGAATILLQIIAGVSILFLVPLYPFVLPQEPRFWILLLVACVFYALNDRLQTTVRKHLPVSLFSIVSQSSTIFLILIGIAVFREPFIISKIIGASCILAANILLVYKRGSIKIDPNVLLGFAASFMFAIAISIDIGLSQKFNLPFYIMLTLLIPALMVLLVERISKKKIMYEFNRPVKKYYIITGLSWGLAIFFSLRAFTFGTVTTVVPLQATSVLLNILMAYIFLHERHDQFKKIFAAILVIVGVFLTVR